MTARPEIAAEIKDYPGSFAQQYEKVLEDLLGDLR